MAADLSWFANFLANSLPLVVLVVLDSTKKRLALVFGKLGVVHILMVVSADEDIRWIRNAIPCTNASSRYPRFW